MACTRLMSYCALIDASRICVLLCNKKQGLRYYFDFTGSKMLWRLMKTAEFGDVSQIFQKLMGFTEPFEPMIMEPLHSTQAVLTHEKNITKNKEWMTLMRAAAVLKCAWRKTRAPDIRFSAEFVSTFIYYVCFGFAYIFRLKRKSIVSSNRIHVRQGSLRVIHIWRQREGHLTS